MEKTFVTFLILLSAFACVNHDEPTHTGVKIRITNTSDFDYTDVYVNTSGGEFNFGNVMSKESTAYHEFESAYRYAYVTLRINNNECRYAPIDYVGERHLSPGNYSYNVSAAQMGSEYQLDISLGTN
jgi:hypothetical protein